MSNNNNQIEKKTSKDLNSREYFDKIDKLTSDLYVFVNDSLLNSRRVLKEMDSYLFFNHQFEGLKDYKMFVKIFVMTDLYHIYKELRCKISAFENEGKILFLYGMKAIGKDTNVNFEIFNEMCNPTSTIDVIVEYRRVIEKFLNDGYNEKLPYYPNKGFLMQDVLEADNLDLMDMAIEYVELMSKFATVVADAKGKLTTEQRKWIAQIPLSL